MAARCPDPRRPRTRRTISNAAPKNTAALLDAYMQRCVKPAGLPSLRSVQSRVSVLKEYLEELPLDALEEPDNINHFKTESDYAEEGSKSRQCIGRSKHWPTATSASSS